MKSVLANILGVFEMSWANNDYFFNEKHRIIYADEGEK